MSKWKKYAILTVIMTISLPLTAQYLYVSDVMHVPVRSGTSRAHKVLITLKSGDRVTIIDDEPDNGFIEVKTSSGIEGYMPKRYLLENQTAATRLKSMERRAEKAKANNTPLKSKVKQMQKTLLAQKAELKSLKLKAKTLQSELKKIKSVSGKAIALAKQKDELETLTGNLKSENQGLTRKNISLQNDKQNEGIKLGIVAVALGALLGLALPFLKPRKTRSSNGAIRLR